MLSWQFYWPKIVSLLRRSLLVMPLRALRNTVAKIGATRSGRYAIEKAVQEATKAVRAGASPAAIAAAEKRFSANKIAMK
ncbi:hypothetical protein, partial [Escherichia coli]|uniref:hypothetical protein n=1 Tax=Escherichia coli TaxID=562 RepID=UPI0011EA4DEE